MLAKPSAGAVVPMPVADRLKWASAGWATGAVISVLVLASVTAGIAGSESDSASVQSGESGGADVSLTPEGASPALEADARPVETTDLPIGWMFAAQWPLWMGMLGAAFLARRHGLQWREQLGWQLRIVDIPVGAAVGIAMQLWVVPFLYAPIFWVSRTLDWEVLKALGFQDLAVEDVELHARELIDKAHTPLAVAALVVMAVVMAPLAEEVFFRGLLQGALQDRFNSMAAVGGASLIFALVHFQPLQFPALLMVGAVHGLMLKYSKRLGASLCSHAAFNAVTVVILL